MTGTAAKNSESAMRKMDAGLRAACQPVCGPIALNRPTAMKGGDCVPNGPGLRDAPRTRAKKFPRFSDVTTGCSGLLCCSRAVDRRRERGLERSGRGAPALPGNGKLAQAFAVTPCWCDGSGTPLVFLAEHQFHSA